MDTPFKGVTLTVWRLKAEGQDWLSMVYRATDHVAEANEVMQPFLEARRMINQKELDGYEASLTELEKAAVALVEAHPRRLQEWEALPFLGKVFGKRPERPSDEAVKIFERVTSKRTELRNRIANPLMDFQLADGEAVLTAMLEQLTGKGFSTPTRKAESNGEFYKEVIELSFIQ